MAKQKKDSTEMAAETETNTTPEVTPAPAAAQEKVHFVEQLPDGSFLVGHKYSEGTRNDKENKREARVVSRFYLPDNEAHRIKLMLDSAKLNNVVKDELAETGFEALSLTSRENPIVFDLRDERYFAKRERTGGGGGTRNAEVELVSIWLLSTKAPDFVLPNDLGRPTYGAVSKFKKILDGAKWAALLAKANAWQAAQARDNEDLF